MNRPQFSLSMLILSVTAFSVAAAIFALCWNAERSPDVGEIWVYLLILTSPATAPILGVGVGALFGRPTRGALIGFLLVLLAALILIYWWFGYSIWIGDYRSAIEAFLWASPSLGAAIGFLIGVARRNRTAWTLFGFLAVFPLDFVLIVLKELYRI